MKRLILMGASGSIGSQTLDVIRQHSDELKLVGLSVGYNIDFLVDTLKEFPIAYAYTIEPHDELKEQFPDTVFYDGNEGLLKMAALEDYDMLVNTLVGFVGLEPTLAAIRNHKDVALANKEALVAGGRLINDALKEYKTHLYPIDSEHVAIWQCLQGHPQNDI
ncbi:MAG: 1-deoxy-D-xylulose-5-phosphate reductoisomerase, partial [Erysipelotrichaceae bacterium]|nr:1-deoxy-D-xylulose-5-phosphate reductoisomerase [Erysipelotrichaceae bacterium]